MGIIVRILEASIAILILAALGLFYLFTVSWQLAVGLIVLVLLAEAVEG